MIIRKKTDYISWVVVGITLLLFAVPFFWLASDFVDLGGDGGRLYFLNPGAVVQNILALETPQGITLYAMAPHIIFFYLLHKIISSPTYLIALDHGLQLSLAFYAMYLVTTELLSAFRSSRRDTLNRLTGLVSAIVYVSMVTRSGWVTSLVTLNQIFLNPLMFYFLLKYCLCVQFRYAVGILIISLLYSGNFGFMSTPQLFSFYPFAILFLYIYVRLILHKSIPWLHIMGIGALFIGLHAFHVLPTIGSLLDKGTQLNSYVFSANSQQSAGVNYFDANRQDLGKLSRELFQPSQWNGQTIFILLIPLITFLGFIKKRVKLLSILGCFFAVTFYLTTANITTVGVRIYRRLFYIPGFVMFRSFNDRWYYVFVFFYTLLFAVSFYILSQKKKGLVWVLVGCLVSGSVIYRTIPFIRGLQFQNTLYQSRNVPVTYEMDPYLMEAISYIHALPDNGTVLTLPLTLPYYQVIYGKSGGAYVGISLVSNLGGKRDYSGLWSFGVYQAALESALANGDSRQVLQLLSLLGVRYIFRDTDSRIMNDFPNYPFYRFDRSTDIPPIDSQNSYDQFLKQFPITTRYEKGFFRIQEFDGVVVRPAVYTPDIVYASLSGVLNGSSFRSAYVDADICNKVLQCGVHKTDVPQLSFHRVAPETYSVDIDTGKITDPFLIILSEDYHQSWSFELNGAKIPHVPANGYANGWIIDPKELSSRQVTGIIRLGFQKYFAAGSYISGATIIIIIALMVWHTIRKKHEKQ